MEYTLWNILDTAIKIGLGASISGVATYKITTLNHNNDKIKWFFIFIAPFGKEAIELSNFDI